MRIDIRKIEEIVGKENYSDNIADLYVYSSDASVHQAMPAVIVKPNPCHPPRSWIRYLRSFCSYRWWDCT
jgi:hypothetical protein